MKYSSSFLQKIFDKFRPLQIFDDGESDQDLRMMLARAMREVDKAFDWICEVYSEKGVFIYSTYVIMGGTYESMMRYYRRTFTLSSDGKSVIVGNDAVEVKPKQVWETAGEESAEGESEGESGGEVGVSEAVSKSVSELASESAPSLSVSNDKPCSCKNPPVAVSEESKSIIAANLDNNDSNKNKENNSMDDKDKATLVSANVSTIASSSLSPLTLSESEALAACPSLKPLVDGFRAQQDKRKTLLVSKLSEVQSKLTKDQLATRTLEQLEEYEALLDVEETNKVSTEPVDYSLLGAAENSGDKKEWRKLPDPWGLEKKKVAGK